MKNFYTFLFLIISFEMSYAQWTNNPAQNTKLCNATGDQAEIRIIPDGAGGAITVWMDSRPTGNTDIYAQRVDSAGLPKWTPNGVIICNNSSDQAVPALVEDGNGGAIIVWKDLRNGNSDLYAQRINNAGLVQWVANGVPVDIKTGDQIEPKLVADGAGGAIITWQDSMSGNWNIYAQRINSQGSLQWSAGGVAVCTAANDQKNPRIEIYQGEAVITWQDKRTGNDYDIYAQKLDGSGVIKWAANGAAVCTAVDTQNNPKIENDGSGGVIIGWADKRNGNDYNVYAQRLSSTGSAQWTNNGISVCSEANNQSALDISTENISGAIFTWKDYRNNIYADIYAQYIDLSGNPQWTINGIAVVIKPFDQLNPNIITDASGCIIVWQDSSAGQWEVYAQKLSLSGAASWVTNGKVVGNAANNQLEPKHISDGKGGAIVAFMDNRDTSKYDIYVQNINFDGSLGVFVGMNEPVNVSRYAIYPNPNAGKFIIADDCPDRINENKTFSILNSLGEVVFSSNDLKDFPFAIDLSGLRGGIYFLVIKSGNDSTKIEKFIIE